MFYNRIGYPLIKKKSKYNTNLLLDISSLFTLYMPPPSSSPTYLCPRLCMFPCLDSLQDCSVPLLLLLPYSAECSPAYREKQWTTQPTYSHFSVMSIWNFHTWLTNISLFDKVSEKIYFTRAVIMRICFNICSSRRCRMWCPYLVPSVPTL